MARVVPKAGRPFVKTGASGSGDVTGLLGLVGEGKRGTVAVAFTTPCICRIVSNMLGEEIDTLNDDILDAVGEIANMVSGGARAQLAQTGYDFEMAIPSIVTGGDYTVQVSSVHPVVVIPFETDAGPFFVEVCIGADPSA